MKNKKTHSIKSGQAGFAPIIILIIIAVAAIIGGGVYFIKHNKPTENSLPLSNDSKTQDDTKDWKTYRNEEYGFEFKYLGDWSFEEVDPVKAGEVNKESGEVLWINFFGKSKIKSEGETGMIFAIEISTKLEDFQKHSFDTEQVVDFGPKKEKKTAYLEIFQPESKYECYGIATLRGGCDDRWSVPVNFNNYYYIISGDLEQGEISDYFKQILSTFKFIK